MQSKSLLSTHQVVFFNLLMLVVTKGHTYSNKPSMYDLLLPPGIKGLIGVLAIFKE